MNFWTQQEVDKFRALAAEGLSAKDIAAQLPGRTVSMVSGAAHRWGISIGAGRTRLQPDGPVPPHRVQRVLDARIAAALAAIVERTRRAQGLSQSQLAYRAGLTEQYLSRVLNAKAAMSFQVAVGALQAMGVTMSLAIETETTTGARERRVIASDGTVFVDDGGA